MLKRIVQYRKLPAGSKQIITGSQETSTKFLVLSLIKQARGRTSRSGGVITKDLIAVAGRNMDRTNWVPGERNTIRVGPPYIPIV